MSKSRIESQIQNLSRRDFLKCLSGAAASAVLLSSCDEPESPSPKPPAPPAPLSPRVKAANVFVNAAGQPLLVCVTGTDFEAMLIAGLARIGGLSKLIGANQEVLIKPNCNNLDPYPGITDTNSLISIIKEVKKVTNGAVKVGDQGYIGSPGVYSFSGMDPQVTQAGATLLNLNQTYNVKRAGWSLNTEDFKVYSDVYDAPIIINTCVLKRHHTADYTCAIKNLVGTVSGPNLVSTREWLHREAQDFLSALAEIAGAVNPELTIVDARQVLTIDGPAYNAGVVVDANKIVICGDIVATDVYCQQILADHDPEYGVDAYEGCTQHAQTIGLGTKDLSQVEVIEITV